MSVAGSAIGVSAIVMFFFAFIAMVLFTVS
jgi:hypothetical protein